MPRLPNPCPIVLIVGPTASGKTRLALDLARALPGGGECVCADSMQIYRGMDIGTAKPTAEERAAVTHHLLDLVEPSDDGFSVDQWLALAEAAFDAIRARGRWPVVVGGTSLYVQALLEGLFEGPPADALLRAELDQLDAGALRRRLESVDPAAAARIHPNDRRRSIRAIEVHVATGRPISDLQQQWHQGAVRPDVVLVGLDWPVEALNRRINARVREMVTAGLVEEVRALWAANRLGRQAREALGYKQIVEHLEGRSTLDDAVEQIKIRTRRFAKQQRSWLRRFRRFPRGRWLAAAELDQETLVATALEFILSTTAEPASGPRESPRRGEHRGESA